MDGKGPNGSFSSRDGIVESSGRNVDPNKIVKLGATYTVTNILSWESATRFRKGTGESGSYTSRGPVIESTERTWDANKYLGIGGNLRCKWIWEKSY